MKKSSKASAPDHGVYASITALSDAFGKSRRTIAKYLANANVQPSGMRRGFPVCRLRDVFDAFRQEEDRRRDPDKMSAFERLAHFKAESGKIEYEREYAQLIPASEVTLATAHILKCIERAFAETPDILARDCGLPPQSVAMARRHFNAGLEEVRALVNAANSLAAD